MEETPARAEEISALSGLKAQERFAAGKRAAPARGYGWNAGGPEAPGRNTAAGGAPVTGGTGVPRACEAQHSGCRRQERSPYTPGGQVRE